MPPEEHYREALDSVLLSEESRKALRFEPEAVVRPDDVYGLFSTEPDLAGGFTNISYFVRDQDRNADGPDILAAIRTEKRANAR